MKNFGLKLKLLLNKEVGILFLLSLTPFLWIGNGWIILGHDSGFRPNISHHMQMLFNTWNNSINTGVDWSLYKGFLMIQLPEYILQRVFGSLESAQPFIFFFWFFLMAICMFVLIKNLFPEKKYWFIRIYVSIFWVFNFFILQGWFIGERAKFSLYAALPLAILLIKLIFERKLKLVKGGIIFGLIYFFLNGGGSPPLYGATLVAWISTWLVYTIYEIKIDKLSGLLFALKTVVFCLMFFLLFNSYWILMQIDLLRGMYSSAVGAEGGLAGLIAWEREISKNASILNLLRLQGIPDWYNNAFHAYSNTFLSNPILIIISLIPIISIILGIIRFRLSSLHLSHKKIVILLIFLLIMGLFFAGGSHPPLGKIYLLMMQYVPGFAIFRSSFYKFAPLILLPIILLSGYYLFRFIETIRIIKIKNLMFILVLLSILLYHYPFFNPSFFRINNKFSTRVKLPSYVNEAGNYINKIVPETGRVLLLPALDRGYINKPIDTYSWGFYSLDVLPRLVTNKAIIANDSDNSAVKWLYESINQNDETRMQLLISKLEISHILFREDVLLSSDINIQKSAENKLLLTKLYGSPVVSFSKWHIFAVQKQEVKSDVKANVISVSGRSGNETLLLKDSSDVVISDPNEIFPASVNTIEAECFYCNENEYDLYKNSISFPPKKTKIKEFISKFKSTNYNSPESEIDFLISDCFDQLLNKSYGNYEKNIKRISDLFDNLSDRQKIIYSARIAAFLKTHSEFIKSNPDETTRIESIIETMFKEMEKYLWVSDVKAYKLGININSSDTYEILSFPAGDLIINNQKYKSGDELKIETGYLKVEYIRSQDIKKPIVFVSKKSVLDNDKSIVVYPYSFDSRWNMVDRNIKRAPDFVVDGYANGWLIEDETPRMYSFKYLPQLTFYKGLVVTTISILISIFVLIKLRHK